MYVIYINIHTRKYRIVESNAKKHPDEIRIGHLHTKEDADRIIAEIIKQ